jgi:hypothetical protein
MSLNKRKFEEFFSQEHLPSSVFKYRKSSIPEHSHFFDRPFIRFGTIAELRSMDPNECKIWQSRHILSYNEVFNYCLKIYLNQPNPPQKSPYEVFSLIKQATINTFNNQPAFFDTLFKKYEAAHRDRFQVLCLSHNNLNNFCWEIHAEHYSGFCIELDAKKLFLSTNSALAGFVYYKDSPIDIDIRTNVEELVYYTFYYKERSKFKDEEEVRYCRFLDDDEVLNRSMQEFDLNMHDILSITFGHNMNYSLLSKYSERIVSLSPSVKLFKTRRFGSNVIIEQL